MKRKSGKIQLKVLINGEKVGSLQRKSSGQVSFQYSKTWLENPKAVPISLSLPLRQTALTENKVRSFFENLLPDNDEIKKRLAEKFQANSIEAVELLGVMGKDCVGALQIIPENEEPPKTYEVKGEEVSNSQIYKILNNLSRSPLGLQEDDDFRISIAGAQEKTAFLWLNNKWHRPVGATPSTHIFKPQLGMIKNKIDMTTSVENEWICLKIAHHYGLKVPSAEIFDFNSIRCLVVERFDRRHTSEGIVRIPQEDLCQALGVSPTKKYQKHGGPSIKQIIKFLTSSDYQDQDRKDFIKAQILFQLLGATDGHSKNFSIFITPSGFAMTPLYDILSLHPALHDRQIERKDCKLAMSVGDNNHYRVYEIQRKHWYQTIKSSDFSEKILDSIFEEIFELSKTLEKAFEKKPREITDEYLNKILSGIQKNLSILE